MPIRLLLAAAALLGATASTVVAQQTKVKEKAQAFTLDGLAPDPAATPTAPATGATPSPDAAPAVVPTPTAAPTLPTPAVPENAAVDAAPVRAVFTLDTPIQDLIADPAAKAVLDRDLPGMSEDENLDKFKMLSLRSLQPQTGGQLTDALLAKVASDLNVLGGGSATAVLVAPVKAGNSRRNKDASR